MLTKVEIVQSDLNNQWKNYDRPVDFNVFFKTLKTSLRLVINIWGNDKNSKKLTFNTM